MLVQSIPYPAEAGGGPSYGPELVVNGTFDTDTSGWRANNAILSVAGGRLRVANDGAVTGYAFQEVAIEAGATYAYSIDAFTGTDGPRTRIGTSANGVQYVGEATAGRKAGTFVATGTSAFITCRTGSSTSGNSSEFDNISLKKLL